jgi:hypothetical protein
MRPPRPRIGRDAGTATFPYPRKGMMKLLLTSAGFYLGYWMRQSGLADLLPSLFTR